MVNSLLFPDSDPGGLWGPYDDQKDALKRAFLAAQSAPKPRQINDRGLVAPFVGYDDGSWDWGVPGLLWGPWEAAKEMSKAPIAGPGTRAWYDEEGSLDPTTAHTIEGAGQIVGAAMMGGVAVPRAGNIATLSGKNARIFDPPSRPQRPFEWDYPSGATADETGRLTHDIEGVPLSASHVAGRREAGGHDVGLSPAEISSVLGELGIGIHDVSPRAVAGDAGRYVRANDRGGVATRDIRLSRDLPEDQRQRVLAHEAGHGVDDLAAGWFGIPDTDIKRQLAGVYNTLNNPNRSRDGLEAASWGKPARPQDLGYRGDDIPAEYMAEAIRAYMANPNYLKTEAPETAARIREYVNENPRLNKVIQFNANPDDPKTAALGALISNTAGKRELSPLGYYSKLDEVLSGLRPTDTVTAETLAKRGVKKSEMEARGLAPLLEGKGAKVSDLQATAKANPVEMREARYGGPDNPERYSRYSLDKGANPSYQESVLHMPEGAQNVITGHWLEPNIIAHARTSMQRDSQGRPVFHVDELQSDWGQKLRDGGVRNEAKIAELKRRLDEARKAHASDPTTIAVTRRGQDLYRKYNRHTGGSYQDGLTGDALAEELRLMLLSDKVPSRVKDEIDEIRPLIGRGNGHLDRSPGEIGLLEAELQTAKAATPGHPLVNTSDQWQETALRRLIRQAAESDAEAMAIPSGDTVLGYGMGGEAEGMRYAYNSMYPKKLAKELSRLDPSIRMSQELLAGHELKGPFSYFPLTHLARKKALDEGFSLFANAPPAGLAGLIAEDQDTPWYLSP